MTLPTSDDTRDREHPATDGMQEAEAWVAYLRQYVVNNPDRDLETAVDGIAAVIRALMERLSLSKEAHLLEQQMRRDAEAKIAALEAEVDLLLQDFRRLGIKHRKFAPAEIAARVEQNRKEQNG